MTPVLETKNLCKSYLIGDTVIKAVCNVNLVINRGDFMSITGKSGSGKSTLMHMLGLLDTPTSGELILNGKNTKGMNEKELARIRNSEIGFVFQTFNLLQRTTVLENVILPLTYSKVPKEKHEEMALEVIKQVNLEHRLNNRSNELSGGERQRVAIARALINNPSLILADEPTGNLDSKTGDEIEKIFLDLNKKGRTIVLVTHDQDLAKIAKREIVLKDGEIIDER
ncbi:MAG TPA: ABC transporter ATP-binding protein [bacterium]|nr:ABC transporter ATP-binding protein [bacterium]HQG58493.1 ABC transporter ATP-binding protein [bacterium]HQG78998.1 ABC transporter ATP-binding protein [bacterium]HQK41489.1 ABC transporter ATP-binding protein [bacterium]